jgi:hypothetical protein
VLLLPSILLKQQLNYIEFPTSFDFMINILKLLGVDDREFVRKIAEDMTDDRPGGVLNFIEEAMKWALRLNLVKMIGCDVNPIIPDGLIAPAQGDDENGYRQIYVGENYGTNFPRGGMNIDMSLIDAMGYLKVSPLDENGKLFYFDTEYKVNELYKSTDFNVFLWYVINKGMPAPLKEREKLAWDNRIKVLGISPQKSDITQWFDDSTEVGQKRKKIIDVVYVENGTKTIDRINIKINPENYYRCRKIFKKQKYKWNKSIYEFTHDYLNSMKLLHKRPILTSLLDTITGGSLKNISVKYSLNEEIIMAQVGKIIKNLTEAESTEIEDCYFSFSNDDFEEMLKESELNMLGKTMAGGVTYEFDANKLLTSLDAVSSAASKEEEVTAVENTFYDISATPAKDGSINTSDSIGFGSGWLMEIIKAFIYPIVKIFLSPKVLILFQIYSQIMGKATVDFIDLLKSIFSILKNIIKMLIDWVIKWLLNWVLKKLKPLLEMFAGKLFIEMLSEYRALLQIMLDCLIGFKINKVQATIDDVNYADIVPEATPTENNC